VQIPFRRIVLLFFWRFLSTVMLYQNNKKKRSPGLVSYKSLREFRYSHTRRYAFKNPDFIRSALAHELFGLPLTASCACPGERAPNRRFVMFAAKTSFTVAVVVKGNFVGLLCRIFAQILGRFALFLSNSIERKSKKSRYVKRDQSVNTPKCPSIMLRKIHKVWQV